MERVRDLDATEVGGHPPAAILASEQPALDEGADQLLDPERRPGGALQDVAQAGRQLLQAEQVPTSSVLAVSESGGAPSRCSGAGSHGRHARGAPRLARRVRAQRAAEEDRRWSASGISVISRSTELGSAQCRSSSSIASGASAARRATSSATASKVSR